MILSLCLSMICAQTLRVCRVENRFPLFWIMLYEKNAIFSAWLIRRIGASGSEAEALGFRTMPVARIVEPREGSGEGSAEDSRGGLRDDLRDGLRAASGVG